MLTVSTPSNAQQEQQVVVTAFLSFRPTTVGIGQEVLINFWISPAPGAHRQYHDLSLIVTKPNGDVDKITGLNTYVADGTMWMPFVPDQVGEWSFQLVYPGEYFAAGTYMDGTYFAPGEPLPPGTGLGFGGSTSVYNGGAVVAPSSTGVQKLIVQEEIIPSWPEAQKPTDYWTRPVDEIHREWWSNIGSYPWFGPAKNDPLWDAFYPNTNPTYNSAYAFVPWVSGPESAHVAWKRQYQLSGLMGGDYGGASYVGSGLGTWRQAPNIILMGMAYHSYAKPSTSGPNSQTYWECYDIRTGEVYWERPLYPGETAPDLIEWTSGQVEVDGGVLKPTAPVLLSISNGYMRKYAPFTGVMSANVSIAPMTGNGGTYYKNGYVLGIQDLGADAGAERYRLINWTTAGNSANFASRVISNTTYARSALPTAHLTDWNVGIGCTVASISEGGVLVGMNITAFDLLSGVTLWNKYVNEPQYGGTSNVADHGKLAVMSANGYYLAFDLKTGNDAWRTRQLDYPWDASGFGSYSTTTAYGQLYWMAQSGIYAIDWATGDINWKFEKAAPPFETPYTGSEGQTVYPLVNAGICADGKIYVYSNKHTPEAPFYRGEPTLCIDVFTGKEVWSVGFTGGSDMRRTEVQLAVADGYFAMAGRDGYMYVFGKGLSETTISASQVAIPFGQKALLTGTVLDLSPAQQYAPCVSKESVAAQMEQMHIGASVGGIYGNVTMVGVPVSLDVLDPNGNYYNIGTTTSDGYSGTFAFDGWTPEVAGLYTITATFMGDESYGSSFATTHLTVDEGSNNAGTNNTILYAVICTGIAIIVVVILVGFLILRKK
ncbi:MAG: PQQ-binding-like beta-propeller repeat protein [Nitrososphaerota archaeon]|jgi:hypothetical protein|nr:PQQ-binding-like beta-propeller repeat protein [Nitrososphaerota archaeon]